MRLLKTKQVQNTLSYFCRFDEFRSIQLCVCVVCIAVPILLPLPFVSLSLNKSLTVFLFFLCKYAVVVGFSASLSTLVHVQSSSVSCLSYKVQFASLPIHSPLHYSLEPFLELRNDEHA